MPGSRTSSSIEIDVLAVENRQRGFAARRPGGRGITLQDCRERVAHPLVVVDDQDGLGFVAHRAAGNGVIVSGG